MPLNGTSLARAYFDGLKRAYHEQGAGKEWDHFVAAAHGAGGEDLDTLKVLYPHLPASLAELLCLADGTYYREYRPGEKTLLAFLGSSSGNSAIRWMRGSRTISSICTGCILPIAGTTADPPSSSLTSPLPKREHLARLSDTSTTPTNWRSSQTALTSTWRC